MGAPAIFLDRDGVVNANRSDHVKDWAEFRFLPGTIRALSELTRLGVPILVVTNQAVINRRIVSHDRLADIHTRMVHRIERAGGRIDAVLFCPHDAGEECTCRKPKPGMIVSAAEQFDVDLTRSVLVGDAATDILAGKRAGCRTVLVMTGRGRETLRGLHRQPAAIPDAVVRDLSGAVRVIAEFLSNDAHAGQPRDAGAGGFARPAIQQQQQPETWAHVAISTGGGG